jgi:hypothetical protein
LYEQREIFIHMSEFRKKHLIAICYNARVTVPGTAEFSRPYDSMAFGLTESESRGVSVLWNVRKCPICDRINEAEPADPASSAGDRKPGVALAGDVSYTLDRTIWLGVESVRAKMATGCKATSVAKRRTI